MMKSKLDKKSVAETEVATDGGHFGVGLFVGVVSGAVGMFLFGTKQGRTVLDRMKEEFARDAQPLMETEQGQKLIEAVTETKETVEKTVGSWQGSFPKFKKKQK